MITLTFGDFVVLFLMNLVLAAIVAYVVNYAKRKAELSAEESSEARKHLKEVIRGAIAETRDVLTELRVHEFKIPTGKRRLSRMNSLVEKLSLADFELGTKVWGLVLAPTLMNISGRANNRGELNPEAVKYEIEMKRKCFKDLEWALQRCAELEKNPIVEK
ncbi:MAG TPA: hypothetical protein VMW41_00500 [Candidatus Bathyarchaeia archaeon]|nr:hypothetical protein [Candidatus Bathyarchaeia archaeon]